MKLAKINTHLLMTMTKYSSSKVKGLLIDFHTIQKRMETNGCAENSENYQHALENCPSIYGYKTCKQLLYVAMLVKYMGV